MPVGLPGHLPNRYSHRPRPGDSRPEIADDLHRENNELKENLRQARTEQNRLKETVTQYARVIHVLEVENHRLHEQSHPEGVVLPFHNRE
ncbi:hypothetical protein [Kitasatospora sp. NPDC086791]|uniref:hypothetical protein n=1 Tax=Kitasatospora sp. NPDC086791 TaxID=3155178 RepID=UPI00344A9C41